MNTLDIILCVVLGFLGIRGIFRGLIKEVASLLGLILGFILANSYYALLAPLVAEHLGASAFAPLIAYLSIFLGTIVVVFLAASLLRKIIQAIRLGWLDKLGGGALGIFKGLLLSSILVLALTAFLPAQSKILTDSQLVPYIHNFNTFLSTTLPQDMRTQFMERSQNLQKTWEEKIIMHLKQNQGSDHD